MDSYKISNSVTLLPRPGDIYTQFIDGKYHTFQILKIDTYGEKNRVYHLKIFNFLDEKPREQDINKLEVLAWHAPVAQIDNATYVGHQDIKTEDLYGFHVYLKLTDFKRFLKETGTDFEEVIKKSQDYFAKGNDSCNSKEFENAIGWYSKAIEEFPLYYEAIDNRAFALMDLARWDEAIAGFEDSLRVEPNNFAAMFSIGECLFKMGKYNEAEIRFLAALDIEPGDKLAIEWLDKTREKMINI